MTHAIKPSDTTLETVFGITLLVTPFPIAPELARALSERLTAAALTARGDAPASVAADLRRDAERYLMLRRRRGLRLPAGLEIACDESARAVMRLTVSTPPSPARAVPLVA